MNLLKKSSFILLIALGWITFGCETNNPNPVTDADVRDSAYYESLIYYLWNENLPDYDKWSSQSRLAVLANDQTTFKPRSFDSVEELMGGANGIRKYSDKNSQGNPLDRYSFARTQTEWENTSSGSNEGFGFRRIFLSDDDLRVAFVYDQSPMGKAGVKRGWQILKVNNIIPTTANDNAIYNELSKNNVVVFEFKKPDGTTQTLTIAKAAYKANFLLHQSVITTGGKKIGYFVLESFLGDQDGEVTRQQLQSALTNFKSQGVTELVVDLRYNGGGYVSLSQALANMIAPASAKGKTMFTYKYNELLTESFNQLNSDNDPDNDQQITYNFSNSASLVTLSQVVFITSEETASASELLINNLKPYLNVKLVGENTYGKPVGFPGILIEMSKTDPTQNYYVFPIAFQTLNANNQGDYFGGMTVDKRQIDDVSHDFGDTQEASLKEAVSYITTGQFTSAGPARIGQTTVTRRLPGEQSVSDMFVAGKPFQEARALLK